MEPAESVPVLMVIEPVPWASVPMVRTLVTEVAPVAWVKTAPPAPATVMEFAETEPAAMA